MSKVKLTSTAQIATTLDLGFVIHWSNDGYVVVEDNTTFLGYGVKWLANGYYTPLTYSDLKKVYTYEVSA